MANSQVLFNVFNDLSKHDANARVVAADKLVAEANKGDVELNYSIKRLVRGLSSSRAAARQGYALGLCTLAKQGKVADVQGILNDLEIETKLSKKDKGEEERDKLIGRAFGLLSLIRSGVLDAAMRIRVAKLLVELFQEKRWLNDICIKALCTIVESVDEEELDKLEPVLEPILNAKEKEAAELALIITLEWRRGPDALTVVSKDSLSELRKPLASAWRADPVRLHVVWEQLVRVCVHLGQSKELWIDVVEPALLKGSGITPEKKCAAFLVFGRLVKELASAKKWKEIPSLFSSRLVLSSILQHAKSKMMVLNQPGRLALSDLVTALASSSSPNDVVQDEVRLAVIKEMLKFGDFDGKSGSSSAHDLMAALSPKSVETFAVELETALPAPWAMRNLVELSRSQPKNTNLESRVMLMLFSFGFFIPTDEDLGKLAKANSTGDTEDLEGGDEDAEDKVEKAQAQARQKFFTVLKRIAKGSNENLTSAIRSIWARVDELMPAATTAKKSKKVTTPAPTAGRKLARPMDEDTKKTLAACRASCQWLGETNAGEVNARLVADLERLMMFMGLLMLAPEPSGDLQDSSEEFLRIDVLPLVEDLSESVKELVSSIATGKKTNKKAKRSKQDDIEEEEEEEPISVIVRILLALLSQPSTLVRDLVGTVAKSLASKIADSKQALKSLAEALNGLPEGEEDVDDEDAESEVEEEPEESEGEEDVTPFVAPSTTKSKAKKDEGDAEDESDEESESDDEDIGDFAAYDKALGEFLRQKKLSSQKSREKSQIESEKDLISFRLRVLDVYESVFNRNAEHANLFVDPVNDLLVAAQSAALGTQKKNETLRGPSAALVSRIATVLQKFFKASKLADGAFVSIETFEQQAKHVLDITLSSKNKPMAKLALDAAGFYIKVARRDNKLAADLAKEGVMAKLLMPLLHKLFLGHSNSVFFDAEQFGEAFVVRFPDLSWSILEDLCSIAPRTPYQRLEQINLVSRMLKLRKDTIPERDLAVLRRFAIAKLAREAQDHEENKGKAPRVRAVLKFIQQVRAFGQDDAIWRDLEPLYAAIAQRTESQAVVGAMQEMSLDPEAISVAHAQRKIAQSNGVITKNVAASDSEEEDEKDSDEPKNKNGKNKSKKKNQGGDAPPAKKPRVNIMSELGDGNGDSNKPSPEAQKPTPNHDAKMPKQSKPNKKTQ